MNIRTRIAPTPSGFLHAGNGISFIITYAIARAFGGRILLRIDDLDAERMRLEYVEDIFKTLDWLGLDYDEGASGVEDFFKNHSQHKRLDLYERTLEKLKNTEGVLYACDCSRKMIKNSSINGIYPNTCRFKNNDFTKKDVAWRIVVPQNTSISFQEFQQEPLSIPLDKTLGDFIVRQKNLMPAYQIASLVDDMYFNINFIVRGQDLLNSTAAQVFLAETLALSDKAMSFHKNTFFHHKLMLDTEGVKLSKSQGASSLKDLRTNGRLPTELYQKAGQWLGFERIDNLADLVKMVKITYQV
jgi:glutamyl/glutaminyl-tRNA synthetase